MSRELLMLTDALAREKNVDKEVVFEALEQALASATKKRFKEEADVRVSIDRNTGDYESFRRWQVVSEADLESEGYQILLIDAQDKIPDIEIGDYIEEPLENDAVKLIVDGTDVSVDLRNVDVARLKPMV